jgi:hypothetical protein
LFELFYTPEFSASAKLKLHRQYDFFESALSDIDMIQHQLIVLILCETPQPSNERYTPVVQLPLSFEIHR